jgi:hypothetical protein
MRTLSFRDLTAGQSSEGTSSLDEWYRSVQDTPVSDFSIDDLCRAIRQELHLAHVIPVALQHLQNDPLSGALWDGELASVIARVSRHFWQSEPELASQTKNIMESQDYSFDGKTREEVTSFLEWKSCE